METLARLAFDNVCVLLLVFYENGKHTYCVQVECYKTDTDVLYREFDDLVSAKKYFTTVCDTNRKIKKPTLPLQYINY